MSRYSRIFYGAALAALMATSLTAVVPRMELGTTQAQALSLSIQNQIADPASLLMASAGKKPICEPGLGPVLQLVMAVPYAIAYLLLFVAGIIFMILLLAGALVLIIFYGLAAGLLYATGQSTKQAEPLYDWSKAAFENSDYVFQLSTELNIWYNGNCD